jgi:hypothetical protein
LGTVSGCVSVFGPPTCLDVPNGLGAASTCYGKTLLPSGFVGTPLFAIFKHGQDLPKKQAHIKREKTKEELKPFLTNLGTHMRADYREATKTLLHSYFSYIGTGTLIIGIIVLTGSALKSEGIHEIQAK